MAPRVSEVDFGVVQNDESLSDAELLERMHKIEEQREELAKRRRREELKNDPDLTIKEYRAAHFICHPRCGFVVDRRDEGAIIEHKSQCGWCIEARQQHEKELELKHEGYAKMRYIVSMISKCEEDIKTQQRRIERETREKQQNWEFVVKMAKAKIDEIKKTIKREQGERHKLLNHENETVRNAAQELYQRYLDASEYARSRDEY